MLSRSSTKKSSQRSDDLFSSFARLSETPPAVDASRGAPFEVDIGKYQRLCSVSEDNAIHSSSLIHGIVFDDQL